MVHEASVENLKLISQHGVNNNILILILRNNIQSNVWQIVKTDFESERVKLAKPTYFCLLLKNWVP